MIKVKTELTTKLIDRDPSSVKPELHDILATTRTALKQVRELVSDMNFISLHTELIHCQQLLQSANITTTLDNQCPQIVLSSVEETMLALWSIYICQFSLQIFGLFHKINENREH